MKLKMITALFFIMLAAFVCNAQEQLVIKNGKVAVVKVDTTKKTTKPAEKVGDYTVNGKKVTVYRGPRGGYFYYTGKTNKNGKPEKKYIKVYKP